MKLIENFKKKWSVMTTGEKCKYVICLICDIGGGFLGGVLADKLIPEDAGKIKRFTMKTTIMGLGMMASDVATNEYGAIIDAVMPDKKGENADA